MENPLKDAFSSGQIGSKLWLCEQLEEAFAGIDTIWVYGGWYGLFAFLLLSRGKIQVGQIQSFDVDPSCEPIADMINENWVWQDWQFKAYTEDCDSLKFLDGQVDLVVNTSTEHFSSLKWFNNITKGTWVALQGADMIHDDHVFKFKSLEHFKETFPLEEIVFQGEKEFVYPDWQFKRFMLIGKK